MPIPVSFTMRSPNEILFDNEYPFFIHHNGQTYEVQPAQPIYFEDAGDYVLRAIGDENYIERVMKFTAADRVPDDGSDGDRIVINKQVEINRVRADLVSRIDSEAEMIRGRFITLGSGQSIVYAEKRREAEAYMADNDIDLDEIPHLAAEAAMNEIPIAEQAQIVLTMAEQWRAISAAIEFKRLGAKKAVAEVQTLTALAAITWDWNDIVPGGI